ncbi:MAG: D-2-hydroxyacid dehydrogenase [Rubrivivax sp.]|nr:D-2-hydroxyacid dehydrogenase [Rubrivivax sp.]
MGDGTNDGARRRLLISAATLAALREHIAALPCDPVTLEAASADATLQVHAAFISRDVTGDSTKLRLSDAVQATYAVLRRSPNLQWVHTHSAGADRPIYGELRARGVSVTTSSGANAEVVAQTALAGVLALARRLPHLMAAQREHRWAPHIQAQAQGQPLPADLAGQTVVLVGWGPIARTLQPWLAMLGLRVIVVRRSAAEAAPGIETIRFDALATVLPRADWLILACPLNEETRRLVDTPALARLKPGARVVNVARGEVVDEAALAAALESGHVGGACLDVFEVEPLPAESPLWRHPNVMVMPHSAGQAAGNAQRVAEIFLGNLERWLRGRPLINAIE